jgi:hypothetical protein
MDVASRGRWLLDCKERGVKKMGVNKRCEKKRDNLYCFSC